MKKTRWFAVGIYLMFIGCTPSERAYNHQTQQQLELGIDSLLHQYIKENSPGAAVLVAVDGKPLIKKGYGLRNLETEAPITPTTNMRMASVSKQFTALCVLTLIEQGLMNLDDPVTDYLPYPVFEGIIIEQLMKHTSGLPDYYDHFDSNWPKENIVENADILDWLKTNPERLFKPGTRFQYSNTAYLMLAVIVEKVSGTEFSQFAKTKLFDRLGMDRTQYYNLAKPVAIPERALCHGKETGTFQSVDGFFMNGVMGDGAVYTNLEDYARYDLILRRDSIFSERVYDLIWLPGNQMVSNAKNPIYYASGWFVDQQLTESSHSGGWFGTNTYVYRALKGGLTVAVFCNATGLLPAGEVGKEIRLMSESFLSTTHYVY